MSKDKDYMDLVFKSVTNALSVSDRIGHDPMQGHRFTDPAGVGKSVFNRDFSVEDLIDSITYIESDEHTKDIHKYVFGVLRPIGVTTTATPVEGANYTMVKNHGWLAPKGPADVSEEETSLFSFILTYEGEQTGWALASVHPGRPGETPDLTGLKEGDKLSYAELVERKLTRVIPE